MRHQERRNDLFPFAAYGGHDFALQTQVLDGDVAYNVNEQGPGRSRRRRARPAHVDAHEPDRCGARGAERLGDASPTGARRTD